MFVKDRSLFTLARKERLVPAVEVNMRAMRGQVLGKSTSLYHLVHDTDLR